MLWLLQLRSGLPLLLRQHLQDRLFTLQKQISLPQKAATARRTCFHNECRSAGASCAGCGSAEPIYRNGYRSTVEATSPQGKQEFPAFTMFLRRRSAIATSGIFRSHQSGCQSYGSGTQERGNNEIFATIVNAAFRLVPRYVDRLCEWRLGQCGVGTYGAVQQGDIARNAKSNATAIQQIQCPVQSDNIAGEYHGNGAVIDE